MTQQPYGKAYTVRGWGDEVVTTVAVPREDQLRDFTGVVRGTESGPVILVPTAALTPVDTTPAEPEPGAAYQLGRATVMSFPDQGRDTRWFWAELASKGSCGWDLWPELWRRFGGPGVTIRRLIPDPAPVELPWHGRDVSVVLKSSGRVSSGQTGQWLEMTPDEAEAKAAALLTAARAARKATR